MIHAIRSIRMFRNELKEGDVFWYMTSLRGKPNEIKGPCTIRKIQSVHKYHVFVEYAYQPHGCEEVIEEESVGDLVNEYHGVFLNEADAYAYFAERGAAYASDPYFVARTMRQHGEESFRGFALQPK